MPKPFVTLLGKTVKYIAQLRGGGSALPGLFVEKIDPHFIRDTLSDLEYGVVLVSGTNGKTTTTKMVVELLEGQGLKVFTNRTGSNFTRGVAAALLGEVDNKGNLDADIAVLELDEAHAVHFVAAIAPRYSLLLNVMRDQLDRFGEIDATAKLLQKITEATTDTIVLNREDSRIAALADHTSSKNIRYFGLDSSLRDTFPSDEGLHSPSILSHSIAHADVALKSFSGNTASFVIDTEEATTTLELRGIYNIYNAAAALALTRAITGESFNQEKALHTLSKIRPAFGRGETITVNGQPIELVLVKNPSGFRLGLQSFPANGYATMIAINDNYADGRDMSWLWDVDFDSLRENGVHTISGVRAYDMALRMQYDEVAVTTVETNISTALASFIDQTTDQPKRIYCTYTAMTQLRKELSKITDVEVIS
ncbi:Mur ligase [Candidatus Saccharibacteria bacterium RIFCSPHIGHO2_01_FULL_46_30]|nr:MAG: Mur ligase [Candidatus Saccharibacteria bacterium RIFCSPHIGHO2_01_FULL_46_30]